MTREPGEACDASGLLSAHDVHRSYDDGAIQALRGVDVVIREGEFVAVQGPSGCGKSTLLHLLGGLDIPSRGEIRFRGRSLREIGDLSGYRATAIGFVFQAFHLLPTLTAIENVEIPMVEKDWSAKTRRARAAELLDAVGLGDRLRHLPGKLSGGERQRVAVARSLANGPAVLLADEPTGNLDSASSGRILALLQTIHRERGMAVVMITHDSSVAGHASRIIHMLDGSIAGEPSPAGAP